MSPSIPEQFTGYAAHNQADGKKLDVKKWSYKPTEWQETMVDVKISHCSICGSCIHTLSDGWPGPTPYPLIAGHEIVGEVVRAGKDSGHKVGDRVGVGAQGGSCLECAQCKAGKEMYCEGKTGMIGTYGGTWQDGTNAQGGYADYTRVQGRFAINVPKELDSESAAPLMCAGITVYRPLVEGGAGKGKKVAIVGIGGLGHLGLLFSNALGAETYAISSSDSKKSDAKKLGVDPEHFIIASDPKETAKKWANTFDLIVCTSFQKNLPVDSLYFKLLRPEGRFTIVGLPEEKIPPFWAQALVGKSISFGGSIIGPPEMIKEMLDVAVKHNVKAWTEAFPMDQVDQKLKDMKAGKPRYRFVMVN